jgi:type III secretion protein V
MFFEHHGDNLFNLMRDELFNESGIDLPYINIAYDPALAKGVYYFSYNAYTSVPEYLTMTDDASGDRLRALLIRFSAFLRDHAYALIDTVFLEQQLMRIESLYPDLTRIIRQRVEYPLTVKVLRLLARESISLRHLPLILESILSREYIIADDQQYIIFDDRIAARPLTSDSWKLNASHVVEYVRIQLRRQISHQYLRGESMLSVYLLEPEIEKWIDSTSSDELLKDTGTIEKIHSALAAELEVLAKGSKPPVILTINKIRQSVLDMVGSRFPDMHVLSYQELTTDTNVQPIARISLS